MRKKLETITKPCYDDISHPEPCLEWYGEDAELGECNHTAKGGTWAECHNGGKYPGVSNGHKSLIVVRCKCCGHCFYTTPGGGEEGR